MSTKMSRKKLAYDGKCTLRKYSFPADALRGGLQISDMNKRLKALKSKQENRHSKLSKSDKKE
jgi:hypothetical protein